MALSLLVATTIAVAATRGLFDRYVTSDDVDARVMTVTRTVVECVAPGDCAPPRKETVGLIGMRPADGVTFVDPAGKLILVTPATGTVGYESSSEYGRELGRSPTEGATTTAAVACQTVARGRLVSAAARERSRSSIGPRVG